MKPNFQTPEYSELSHKAYMFAKICEYELVEANGYFEFYNSPSHRSFTFDVDPSTYNGIPSTTIIAAFLGQDKEGE